MSETILTLQAVATIFLCGVIWFVQLVHYPLLARVGAISYAKYQAEHERRTTWVVAPAMVVEFCCAAALIVKPPSTLPLWSAIIGLALVLLIWASTFFLQVPRHRVLEGGFDRRAHAALVGTNWLRTIAWTARVLIVLYMLQD